MKIIIVGAGIGGLVTALRLHHEGIDCVVYEQSEQIRELGVGINVLPYAVKELATLGLLDQLDLAGIRTQELRFAHRLGDEILRRPCDTGTFPQFSIHRGRLQGLLLRAVHQRLGPRAVRTGHRLTTYEQDVNAVHASFVDPQGNPVAPVRCDILVGADGIHSTVRSRMFPHEGPPRWNGLTMWRGATDWPPYDSGRTMIIAGGTPAKIVVYPIAPGQTPRTTLTNWVICAQTGQPGDPVPSRQEWSHPANATDLQHYLNQFNLPGLDHAGLIKSTQESFIFPMCDRDPLPFWTYSRVTLLGDAAHPMYPMGSNGAGQAILDATTLATHLAHHPRPTDALQAYQHDRLPPTSAIVHRNRQGGPEGIIDLVERRAPHGFTHIHDILNPAELKTILGAPSPTPAIGNPAR